MICLNWKDVETMNFLSTFDYCVIAVYFLILVGLGIYLKRKASASIEDYFIGGRRVPWWALGVSGMASYLDIAGTVVIVSMIFLLGPRGLQALLVICSQHAPHE